MQKKLSSLDLHFLLKELDILIGSKVDKVFQKDKEEITFQLHATGKGKQLLKISLPSMIYLSQYKGEQPDTPPGFCVFLRKHLKQARLRSIDQKEFERIVDFTFETKERKLHLIVELFSDGNIMLCDENYKIMSPLSTQNWKDRTIRGGIKYTYPQRDNNLLVLTQAEFKGIIQDTNKESLVKSLAIDLGLGGVYAEEICLRAKIDKNLTKLTDIQIEKIFLELENIREEKIQAAVIEKKDIVPLKLLFYKEQQQKPFNSFNEALDETLTEHKIKVEEESTSIRKEKELNKVQVIIDEQERKIKEITKKIDDNTVRGELIYSNYQMIKDIIDEINKAQEKYTWKEIKEKLKGHNVIKEINSKDKTITIELKK